MVLDSVEEAEKEESDGGTDDEEEHLGATNLPSCVIHRMLTGTKKELKANLKWLRTNIFHTCMKHVLRQG